MNYPIISSSQYTHASLIIHINDVQIDGVKSISYSEKLFYKELIRTDRTSKSNGQIVLYLTDWDLVRETIKVRWKPFEITITMKENNLPDRKDQLLDVQIDSISFESKEGEDNLFVVLQLDIGKIIHNDLPKLIDF